MKRFSDLNISLNPHGYVGEKIKIAKLFNREIEIHNFKTEPSKKNESILLTIQIKVDNDFRVIFCGSRRLAAILEAVPSDSFPFLTQIVNENLGYSFQ